mmetsp:Transcript_5293/g.11732  ORF Transcript_5293/g.11732 Transcript_5293/m.11732 type:complete len:134 (+) Transcript_5293:435-836(+)
MMESSAGVSLDAMLLAMAALSFTSVSTVGAGAADDATGVVCVCAVIEDVTDEAESTAPPNLDSICENGLAAAAPTALEPKAGMEGDAIAKSLGDVLGVVPVVDVGLTVDEEDDVEVCSVAFGITAIVGCCVGG